MNVIPPFLRLFECPSPKQPCITKCYHYYLFTEMCFKPRNVFLLDEDISLRDLDLQALLRTWACAFWPQQPPLIVQPLIAESTQLFDYVTVQPWSTGRLSKVVASASGWVEQQAPLLNAEFFAWFVRRVLVHTRSTAFRFGADWSADKTWCGAARNYSVLVLNWSLDSVPCALITAPGCSVHHLNTRTMRDKRANRPQFRQRAREVMNRYQALYPTWVEEDVRRKTNPLDAHYGPSFKKVFALNERCERNIP
eukprot:CAMPEP_0170094782 /NCGR_PEP_ID=MMETSP0019_2-20121128/27504_1 /TAXON_ID=98059 /ORGANISM="Dinobryon sp., Strain UTEXLB2267" /LENGTH=251 /DNA_ID=CAMNT_0010316265 /DNA_START=387 /DNA_END=1142 /DNA_ORIENTATION=-